MIQKEKQQQKKKLTLQKEKKKRKPKIPKKKHADTSHRRLTARLSWASSCIVVAGTVNYSTLPSSVPPSHPDSHPDPHPPLPSFFCHWGIPRSFEVVKASGEGERYPKEGKYLSRISHLRPPSAPPSPHLTLPSSRLGEGFHRP